MNFSRYRYFSAILFLLIGSLHAKSQDLDVPRFASLRTDKVNARVGPGLRYPLEWVFVRAQLPVMIIRDFGAWRLVRDLDGAEGWIHRQMLSGLRTVQILGEETTALYAKASDTSKVIARIEPRVIAQLIKVKDSWVEIKVDSYRGWVQRDQLWGILDSEK